MVERKVTFHGYAEAFPLLEVVDPEGWKDLCEDIEKQGLIDPPTILPLVGPTDPIVILDGRNRYLACQKVGVSAEPWDVYQGELTPEAMLDFVTAKNMHRRSLTKAQRRKAGVELKKVFAEEGKRLKAAGAKKGGEAYKPQEGKKSGKLGSDPTQASLTEPKEPKERKKRAPKAVEKAAQAVGTTAADINAQERIDNYGSDRLKEAVAKDEIPIHTADRMLGQKKDGYRGHTEQDRDLRDYKKGEYKAPPRTRVNPEAFAGIKERTEVATLCRGIAAVGALLDEDPKDLISYLPTSYYHVLDDRLDDTIGWLQKLKASWLEHRKKPKANGTKKTQTVEKGAAL